MVQRSSYFSFIVSSHQTEPTTSDFQIIFYLEVISNLQMICKNSITWFPIYLSVWICGFLYYWKGYKSLLPAFILTLKLCSSGKGHPLGCVSLTCSRHLLKCLFLAKGHVPGPFCFLCPIPEGSHFSKESCFFLVGEWH